MQTLKLPGLSEPARVVRHTRASRRLRLALPGLFGNPRLARRVEEVLARSRGVEAAEADPRSGRVLLRYAPGAALLDGLRDEPRRERRRARPGRRPAPVAAWASLSVEETLERLEGETRGLASEEAARRVRAFGPNAVAAPQARTTAQILRGQLVALPSLLLLGSAGLATLIRDYLDAGAILTAIGLDAAIGFSIERKNEDFLAAWRKLEAGQARVLRDGRIRKLVADELTLGDVLLARAGDTVPADARVIDAHRLACDEAILTGESESRTKSAAPVAADAPVAERTSMLHAGTKVVSGRGRALVTAIGTGTEMARIRELLEEEESPKTPFERRLDQLGTQLSLAGVGAGAAAGLAGMLRLRPLGEILGSTVALGVAAIPEGLPVVSTAALVRSMERLRERGMVVRRLVSAETLGGVTVVCADKTGTLTRNEMQVEALDLGRGMVDPATVQAVPDKLFEDVPTGMLAAALLNSDLDVQERGGGKRSLSGSATEKALFAAAEAAGLDRAALVRDFPRRLLRERRGDAHYVLSLHDAPAGGSVAFVKGAPEQVVELCDEVFGGPGGERARETVLARNHALAEHGLRVLAVGWKPLPREREDDAAAIRDGYRLLGLIGLRDPLRPGAAETVKAASKAGIRTVILTGDQQRTAAAVAREVGLAGEILDGAEAARLLVGDGPAARERMARVAAFSRVSPTEKVAIVKALRESGEVVAMAGDGVNDAPALKAADVGMAIGKHASFLSHEAADIVISGEDLGSILHAVGEGRVVQDNLRRALHYLLATNVAEVWLALGSALAIRTNPFNARRLLWLNLLSDTLPAIALALEPARGDVLARPPAPPDAPLVPPEARGQILRDAVRKAGLGAASLALGGPAAAFSAMAGADIGYAFACRAPDAPPDERFLGLLGGTAALHLAAVAFPPFRTLMSLPPALSLVEVAAFGAGVCVPWAMSRAAAQPVIVRRGADLRRPEEEKT